MARLSDRKTITNEEIEASVEELGRKLEILRVRYEQYFIGVEKVAPSMMRMEVVRMMRDLEQLKIKNTAIKFKLRTVVQKFTSYSTYWNRTLREIEDGTYKRHVDKAKREAERLRKESAQKSTARQHSAPATNDNRSSQISSKAVADEADDFLASLGYAPTRERQNAPTNSRNGMDDARESTVNARADLGTSTQHSSLRHRRPAIVGAQQAARPLTVQQPSVSAPPSPAPPRMPPKTSTAARPHVADQRSPAMSKVPSIPPGSTAVPNRSLTAQHPRAPQPPAAQHPRAPQSPTSVPSAEHQPLRPTVPNRVPVRSEFSAANRQSTPPQGNA